MTSPAQTRREFLRLGLAGVGAAPWFASGCASPGTGGLELASTTGPAAFVILSGGGTPLTNNYSQYLQARAWAGWLARTRPTAPRWCFFGVGNREGSPAVLADTYREVSRDGGYEPEWLPGFLPDNRPATRESLFRALREEILPVVHAGGTLFLLVGDHGELAGRDAAQESAITLWQLKRGEKGWRTDSAEVLRVAELRRELAAGLGRGRVVFAMTQCHSGGFHELAVPGQLVPPRAWFTRDPEGIAGRSPRLQLAAAGFTATDEASPAAGCEPDPEPDRWAGYERFFPEALLGSDLMTGAPRGAPAVTLDAAHEAAVLVDHTIDKPRSTSEYYLESWAGVIEEQLANTLAVTETVQRAVAAYQRAVDTGEAQAVDPGWVALRERYRRFQAVLVERLPTGRAVLQLGDRRRLTAVVNSTVAATGRDAAARRRNVVTAARRAWNDTVRPAWKAAVEADRVPGLSGAAREFERHLLRLEDGGRSLLVGRRDGESLLQEVYWRSGHAKPGSVAPAAAREIARWGVARRERIAEWGRTAAEPAVREAAEKLAVFPPPAAPAGPGLTLPIAAERVLFQRRVLAAWRFLLEVGHAPALAELAQLRALEVTSLPPAAAGVAAAWRAD